MSKLAFILCVALIAKANGSVIRSPNFDVTHNPSNKFYVELEQKLADFDVNCKERLRNARDSVEEPKAKAFGLFDNLVEQLEDIFKQANKTAAEYYKEKTAEECYGPIEKLTEEFSRLRGKAFGCVMKPVVGATEHWYNANVAVADYRNKLGSLQKLALECNDNECAELKQRQHDIPNVEDQYKKIDEELKVYTEGMFASEEETSSCMNAQEVLKEYNQNVNDGFSKFSNCAVSK